MQWINAEEIHNPFDVVQILENKTQYSPSAKFSKLGNHVLLFHGTPKENLLSILHEGLTLPKDFTHGDSLGDGVYFADHFNQSFNYCHSYDSVDGYFYMLVCEVALGNVCNVLDYGGVQLPQGYHSVRLMSEHGPDWESSVLTKAGYRIPSQGYGQYKAPKYELKGEKFTVGSKYFDYIWGRKP